MAKYSTGSSNTRTEIDEDTTCELCSSKNSLSKTDISGTSVIVCKKCKSKHGTDKKKKKSNNKESWQKYSTTSEPDNEWVEKTRADYGNVKTPYLVNKYNTVLEKTLSNKNITVEQLSNKLNISTDIIEAILNSNAIQENVTEEQILKIEEELNIKLQE